MKMLAGLVIAALTCFLVLSLFPIHNDKERAKSTADISNMKLLVRAVMLYAFDNDEHLPMARNWTDQAERYIDGGQIISCVYLWKQKAFGHVIERSMPGRSIKDIADPEDQALLFDGVKIERNANDSLLGIDYSRHKGSAAIAYADGHVKRFSPPGLSK